MTVRPGDLWVADITFTDGTGSKKRPVLILWLEGSDAVVAAVTSAGTRSTTDVPLADWSNCGLRLPSTVRLARLDCLERSLLTFQLGHINAKDAKTLRDAWATFVRPSF